MTEEQKELVERFRVLPKDLQCVLELLSEVYFPRSRIAALELVNKAGILRTPSGGGLVFAEWKPVVTKLVNLGLLVEIKHRIQCNPIIMETMMINAARAGRLDRWISIIQAIWNNHKYEFTSYYYGKRTSSDLFRELRHRIYQENTERFLVLLKEWRDTTYQERSFNIVNELFSNPFDTDWMGPFHSRVHRARAGG